MELMSNKHRIKKNLTDNPFLLGLFSRHRVIHNLLFILILFLVEAVDPQQVLANQFVGQAHIVTNDDIDRSQQIKLTSELYFVDKNEKRWIAHTDQYFPKHLISDEVRYLLPLPSDFDYIKTASVYLSQSIVAENDWPETFEILYPALIAEGVQEHMAKMIFAIVYAEGWRWEKLGTRCYASCHASAKVLRWRPIPDYTKLKQTIQWVLRDVPSLAAIKDRVSAEIDKPGPHIFGQ